ncbi:site-specific tyrosine recombinase XerD [Leifsonia xyli subsp. cynodontis DSM 46306]|uniref:Integrase n=1 Tax=Leifsonia xyli subsp. cynodontis DSM 46306 TaxID=1389489 RepID=U3P9F2_LEIXC|nr:site-specific tyrosine recombinase XerD [Leifsonia xyli subsp. cynodontis DSM 46306]
MWAQAIREYLVAQVAAGAPPTTCATRRQHLEHLARRVDVGPWSVTGADLVAYAGAQVWKPETRRGRRSTFRSFYGWAVAVGHVEASPAVVLPRVKPGQARPRPIPEHVYEDALLRSDERLRLILRLAHDAGLRRGEIAVVHSRDLFEDLHGWSLRVRGKGNKERDVPLTPRLALELRTLPPGWAFPGDEGGHLSARWVGKLATGVLPDGWTLHTLRHSFATHVYARSDLAVTQDLLGHASPATTRVYVQVADGRLRSAVLAAAAG